MKMTKVIREYMDETLSAKRVEMNKKARADYDARREPAESYARYRA